MAAHLLPARQRAAFLDAVAGSAKLFAPVADSAGGTVFAAVTSPADVRLDAVNTRLSVKSVFFPQREVLMSYEAGVVAAVPAVDGNIVVFGARPCDARAMTWMDGVFGGGGREDPYFVERRRGAVVVALACDDPCASCFCTSVGGSLHGTDGADVLASATGPGGGPTAADAPGDLLLEPVTEKGAAFLAKHAALLAPAPAGAVEARVERGKTAAARMPVLGFSGVKEKMDAGFDSPAWEAITRSCLGCGACTYVCPTCHCFDITDEGRGDRGVRIRTWDGCQYALFTRHASGHNPRSHKKARMRQRLMHKYSYAPETAGAVFCSGCGRCVRSCPVNLDLREMLAALEGLP